MSDLLDLFRRNQESEDEGKPTPKKPKRSPKSTARSKKKAPKRPSRNEREETVLALTRRQMLYAGSGQVILLGLAFLVGLTFGRGGGDPLNKPTPINAPAVEIFIIAQIPLTDGLGNQRPVDIGQVMARLTAIHEVRPDMVWPRTTKKSHQLAIGPFPSIEAANDFVDARSLGQFRAAGRLPFQKPYIGPIKHK
jgi:hypothetical protein